jgi:hypothetical protein
MFSIFINLDAEGLLTNLANKSMSKKNIDLKPKQQKT